MSDESRIIPLNNGRSPAKKAGDYITHGKVAELLAAEREENEKMVRWYMNQIPELVARMLGDALAVHGLVLKEPPAVDPDAPFGVDQISPPGIGIERPGEPDGDTPETVQ